MNEKKQFFKFHFIVLPHIDRSVCKTGIYTFVVNLLSFLGFFYYYLFKYSRISLISFLYAAQSLNIFSLILYTQDAEL